MKFILRPLCIVAVAQHNRKVYLRKLLFFRLETTCWNYSRATLVGDFCAFRVLYYSLHIPYKQASKRPWVFVFRAPLWKKLWQC